MTKWLAFSCPLCGFRFSPKKFNAQMKPILYPMQIVTGGGRAKGFTVETYLPWSTLPTQQTDTWNSLLCLYNRLGTAYDNFYRVLGFLSPEVKKILQELQGSYPDAYRTSKFQDYAAVYAPLQSSQDIVEAYGEFDHQEASAHLLTDQLLGGL